MSVCIFCRLPFSSKRPRSKEHIWPKWMHDFLPEKPGAQRLFDAADLERRLAETQSELTPRWRRPTKGSGKWLMRKSAKTSRSSMQGT
jgi:hypothetical protein